MPPLKCRTQSIEKRAQILGQFTTESFEETEEEYKNEVILIAFFRITNVVFYLHKSTEIYFLMCIAFHFWKHCFLKVVSVVC